MLNAEIYAKNPLDNQIANNGVAEVKDDESAQALETLRLTDRAGIDTLRFREHPTEWRADNEQETTCIASGNVQHADNFGGGSIGFVQFFQ